MRIRRACETRRSTAAFFGKVRPLTLDAHRGHEPVGRGRARHSVRAVLCVAGKGGCRRRRAGDCSPYLSVHGKPPRSQTASLLYRGTVIRERCRLPVGETAGCQPALRRFMGSGLLQRACARRRESSRAVQPTLVESMDYRKRPGALKLSVAAREQSK